MKRYILLIVAILLGYSLHAQSVSYNCRYWFDQNHAQAATVAFSENNWQAELDVGSLSEGLHTMLLQICDTSSAWSIPKTYMFYKIQQDISSIVYRCWFDNDIVHRQTDYLGDGHLLLDVDTLSEGIHTLNVMLGGNAPQSYMFMKVAVQDPSAEMQYRCWFDDDSSNIQTGSVGMGIFELEVGDLSNGVHTVHIQLDNGKSSVPQSYVFYKRQVGGSIVKWEYWLNGDQSNKHTTNLSPFVDTLDIVTLLPVETWPVRSSCFHFNPNGDEPYINAKNEITFRFWDVEKHFIDKSTLYDDYNVSELIVADTLERNTTVSMEAPRDNQIRWFKLDINRGEYLSFQADKACTMQLFAPSGKEVYSASGPESVQETGFNVWEDGVYYLAVHDVTGSGDSVSITYNWLYKYSVSSYNVHIVGNGGCSTITYQGNGFNNLLDAYYVSENNDTIRSLDIGHKSNTEITVSCNFYEENLGVYDAVFEFWEETIRINGALQVDEPEDIYLTSTVSYPTSFMSGTTVTYDFTITNNGNMSAYAIPLYLYISSPTLESITHLELEGLELSSLADYIKTDSMPSSYVERIKEWAKNQGDDHYFHSFSSVENERGDTVAVRSNYFFINIAPYETKTIKVKITATTGAHQLIETLMSVPDDIIPPYTLTSNREMGKFCCIMQHINCFTSIMASDANAIGFWIDVLSLAFPQIVGATILYHTASCIVSLANAFAETANAAFCNDEQGVLNKILWTLDEANRSLISMALNCLPTFKDLETVANVLNPNVVFDMDTFLYRIQAVGDIIRDKLSDTDIDCGFKEGSNTCFPPPGGGGSGGIIPGDPNDIFGYLSESGSHYMRQEIQNIHYEIEFENDTTLATAAAHTIMVRDTLDATKFDLNSLAAHSVTIGDKRLELNGEKNFARTLDMRPEMYVIAQIEQDYDPATGIIAWTIKSLDPMTMEPTDNPFQGVLPVNYNGNGIGFIDYSVNLKQAFADGTEVSNRAGIVFDQNDVIMTPTWTNIVDAVKPTSQIDEVSFEADTLNFNFVSSDNRSGVWYHTLYYRNDSTEMEWKVKKAKILGNSFILKFDDYQTTEYLVMAVDSAGNHEDKDMVAEYIFVYDGPVPVTQTMSLKSGWNWVSFNVEITLADIQEALVEAMPDRSITIKSQTGKTSYNFNTHRWHGNIASLDVTRMYKIKAASECELILKGKPVNPADHPIIINRGVNWIAFPLNVDMNTVDAFDGFVVNGDKIKSQIGKSQFNNGRWQGQMNKLEPGKGYIYTSSAIEDREFVFPTGAK